MSPIVAVPAPKKSGSVNFAQFGLGVIATIGAVALAIVPFDGPAGEVALGSVAVGAFGAAF